MTHTNKLTLVALPNIPCQATFSNETSDSTLKYIIMKRPVLNHIVKQNSKII